MNIVRISDGLGNQMYQYAFAKKLQLLSEKDTYLDIRFINHEDVFMRGEKDSFHEKCDYREYGLGHFKITLPVADEKILRRWRYLNKRNASEEFICKLAQMHLWPWQYRNEIAEKRVFDSKNCVCSTYFQGYFQDLRYFNDIRPVLQREFCLKNPMRLSSELHSILKKENTVSVHVRRGDFIRVSRDISQKKYYSRALEKAVKNIQNPIYLVFSDDIEWVKRNVEINGRKIYISDMGFSDYEEFAIMKHCRNNITGNSTFSYWAAYLNDNPDKIVICPKHWNTKAIPKQWVCI